MSDEKQNATAAAPEQANCAVADLFGGLRPLAKGDTVQRSDIFIDDGRRFEMDTRGFLLGVRCLGQTIRKDNGGWHRSSPNAGDVPRAAKKD